MPGVDLLREKCILCYSTDGDVNMLSSETRTNREIWVRREKVGKYKVDSQRDSEQVLRENRTLDRRWLYKGVGGGGVDGP